MDISRSCLNAAPFFTSTCVEIVKFFVGLYTFSFAAIDKGYLAGYSIFVKLGRLIVKGGTFYAHNTAAL